jgi:hypothetical protein
MNIKTGLFGLGLLVAAGAAMVSCGGSDGDTDETGGSSSTAGSSSGGSSTAGTTNGTSGNTNGTAGTTNNNGGNTTGGRNNNPGGEGPVFGGGEGNVPGCPATQPAEDSDCERTMQNRFGCPYGDVVCQCNGQQDSRTWSCEEPQGFGGAGPDFGDATCPDNAMTGQDCEGLGPCPGQDGCFCGNGNVFCQ